MSNSTTTPTIDSGHTAWILVSMALVQLMMPGLAFFYAGLLHKKSAITMMMQNFAAMVMSNIYTSFIIIIYYTHFFFFILSL